MQTTRRDLLKVGLQGLSVVSLAGSMPAFLQRFAFAENAGNADVSNDNVLVVVQLSGGNDGLNTVVPLGNDAYFKARPKIAIKDRLLKLDDQLALNPGMTGFKQLFDDGKLAIINGCGYPQPNRSHFRSMEIWHTANPKKFEPCGWLGHYLDHCLKGTNSPIVAANIGSELPQALVAEGAPVPSISSLEDFRLRTDGANPLDAKLTDEFIREINAAKAESPALQYLSRQATNAIISADKIRKLSAGYKPDAVYPYGGLGPSLKLIAQMIHANFGTRLFYCQVGGFDTHANQVAGHESLLGHVATSLAAFMKDLGAKGLDNKVTAMCFSEFGRRVNQNDSNGTDHGAAAPMFVLGGKVKAGLYGTYPSLTQLDDGDLKYTVDFRQIYATILDKWLNADAEKVLNGKFTGLPLYG